MTKKEAATILAILKAAYPNSYKSMTQEEAMGTISVWAVQFADMPADIVLMAVHKAISSSPFPPSISEVRAKFRTIYWEAERLLYRTGILQELEEPLQKKEKDALKRICDVTKDYGYSNKLEPTVGHMLRCEDRMLLGSGTT